MKNFILGTNYWASHAGTNMWKDWRPERVKIDLEILRENGVEYLRVFPVWPDFQPVEPFFNSKLKEYRMADGSLPPNPWYLDPVMLERFRCFCRMAGDKEMKLIVGLLTGWMSGRKFIPSALYEKNLFTDPTALYFEQLFIKGFVTAFKQESAIYAWDLGNECNCMDEAHKREEACSWTSIVTNAIKAADGSRPVISGMHSLTLEGIWNIQDQGEITDLLTTHPYPLWVKHCRFDMTANQRTLLHATAQTQYYATIGHKKCLVEEIGTMGPMLCDEETAAGFLRVNLWSNWANGAAGVMWWCAHDQSQLSFPPYDWNMCERELGMVDISGRPKLVLLEMKAFREQMDKMGISLPYREPDGVCILSQGQDHWGIAYMTYVLAKQAGLTLDFAYCEQELPESSLYFLPSVCMAAMSKRSYDRLKERVKKGAVLYLSADDGFFTEFEELTGFRVKDSRQAQKAGIFEWAGDKLEYSQNVCRKLVKGRGRILAEDDNKESLFCMAEYGKGKVYFLNFPMETMLLTKENGLKKPYYLLYRTISEEILQKKEILCGNPYTGITYHRGKEKNYAVIVNYSGQEQNPMLKVDASCQIKIVYGNDEKIEPFGVAVLEFSARIE